MSNSDEEEYSDGRAVGDWKSYYFGKSMIQISIEALVLLSYLIGGSFALMTIYSMLNFLEMSIFYIRFEILSLFIAGCIGATIFSIKWLAHSAAKKMWHVDRIFWRLLVPIMGGFYACIILIFWNSNLTELGYNHTTTEAQYLYRLAGAFLVGFVADLIGGWLTNIGKNTFGLTG